MSDDDTKHDDPTLPMATLISWLEEWGFRVELEARRPHGALIAKVSRGPGTQGFLARQRTPHIAVAAALEDDWEEWSDTNRESVQVGDVGDVGDALSIIAQLGRGMAQDPKLRGVVALLLSRAIRVAFPEASDVLASVYAINQGELRAKPFTEPEPADVVGGSIRTEDEDDAHYERRMAFARAVQDHGLTGEQLRERCRCGHELLHHVREGKLTDCKHHDGTYRCPCARFRPFPREEP